MLKAYCWRATAVYVWIRVVAAFFGFFQQFSDFESRIINHLIECLSAIGFAPVNTSILAPVLRGGWILVITGFKFYEVLWLAVYAVTIPVWGPLAIAFRNYSDVSKDSPGASTIRRGLRKEKKPRIRWFSFCTLLLFAWFLLYGNAETRLQIVPGVILSGVFFLFLIYRLFLRVTPNKEVNLLSFYWLARLRLTAVDMQKARIKKEYKKRSDLKADAMIVRFTRRMFVRISLLLRGRSAVERVSLFVLAEYITSLIVVAGAAILFWAVVIKAVAPKPIDLLTCFHLSVSSFLPSIHTPVTEVPLPLWTNVGPATTAWVLFVLYISPASFVLPEKQRATINGLSEVYKWYRNSVCVLGIEELRYRRLEKKLPP